MKRIFGGLLLLLFSLNTMAFKCYITLIKSDCWKDYNLEVEFRDELTDREVVHAFKLAKGEMWARKKFECHTKQGIRYKATFEPYIWQEQEGKSYPSKRIWFLPATEEKGVAAWNMPICFPNNFASVPMLPNVNKHCNCSSVKAQIPAIPDH